MKVNEIREVQYSNEDDYEVSVYYDEIAVRKYFKTYYIYYYIYALSDKTITLKKSIYKNGSQILSKEYTIRKPELIEKMRNLHVEDLIETPKQTYQLIQDIFNDIIPLFEPYEKLLNSDA